MDRLSKAERSRNMSRIRGRDTEPERAVRSLLHQMGFRFRINLLSLPGKPDIVMPKYRTVVLVHGCFWHRHKSCRFAYTPKSKKQFWLGKFNSNMARDLIVRKQLREMGWRVIVIWECELHNPDRVAKRLRTILTGPE